MNPFDIQVTVIGIGLIACLVWAAHQRAAVHRAWRRRLRDAQIDVRSFPCWMTAGTVAGLV